MRKNQASCGEWQQQLCAESNLRKVITQVSSTRNNNTNSGNSHPVDAKVAQKQKNKLVCFNH